MKTILELSLETVVIKLSEDKQNDKPVYKVFWSDYVANDWEDTFESLSLAFCRIAVLMKCMEANWNIGFAHELPIAIENAKKFLKNETN